MEQAVDDTAKLYKYLKSRVESADGFIKHLHITFTEISRGRAVAEIAVDEELLNPLGTVHGGCLFSVCDTIGGTAAMTYGVRVTTTMATISYVRPAIGKSLKAVADEIKAGDSLFRYNVSIYDEKDELLCKAMLEYFKTGMLEY